MAKLSLLTKLGHWRPALFRPGAFGEQRMKIAVWIITAYQKGAIHIIGPLALRIAGNATELMRHAMQTAPMERFKAVAARNGLAREALDLEDLLHKLNAQLRPETQWTFHKDQWGPYEVMVFPRVIDSNTGLVTGPSDNSLCGAVVTYDGQPPNCDPAALHQVINGPPLTNKIDAEFVPRENGQ